jgi:hypothetical protein
MKKCTIDQRPVRTICARANINNVEQGNTVERSVANEVE